MRVRVKEGCLGYYGHRRRREFEEFDIESDSHFSTRWMEKPGDEERAPRPRGRPPKAPASTGDQEVI